MQSTAVLDRGQRAGHPATAHTISPPDSSPTPDLTQFALTGMWGVANLPPDYRRADFSVFPKPAVMRCVPRLPGLFWPLMLAALCSCAPLHRPVGKSPLVQPQMSPDSVVLDIIFSRFPFGDERANQSLWKEVDEQQFSTELRGRLAECGFRVGVVSGQVPRELSQLLELSDNPQTGIEQSVPVEDLDSAPNVVPRHVQCRPGKRIEVAASNIYDELPVLTRESGLCGKTYAKAQGMLAIKSYPEPDGRVRVELVPELHYGDQRQRWVGGQGTFRMEAGRERRVFDDLKMSATLAPGEMLLLSSLDCRKGSIGHSFFTDDSSGKLEQKLVVIRLSQTQHDGVFAPEVLPLEKL